MYFSMFIWGKLIFNLSDFHKQYLTMPYYEFTTAGHMWPNVNSWTSQTEKALADKYIVISISLKFCRPFWILGAIFKKSYQILCFQVS